MWPHKEREEETPIDPHSSATAEECGCHSGNVAGGPMGTPIFPMGLPVPRGPNKKKLRSEAKICRDFISMPGNMVEKKAEAKCFQSQMEYM